VKNVRENIKYKKKTFFLYHNIVNFHKTITFLIVFLMITSLFSLTTIIIQGDDFLNDDKTLKKSGLVFENLDVEWLVSNGWDGSDVDCVRLTNSYTNITLTSYQLFIPDELPLDSGTVFQYYMDEFYYINQSARIQYALQFSTSIDYQNPDLNTLLGNDIPQSEVNTSGAVNFTVYDPWNPVYVLYNPGDVVIYEDVYYLCKQQIYNYNGLPPDLPQYWEVVIPGTGSIYPQNFFQTGSKVIYAWNLTEKGYVFELEDIIDVNNDFNVYWQITVRSHYYHIIIEYKLYFQNSSTNDLVYSWIDTYMGDKPNLLPLDYHLLKYYDVNYNCIDRAIMYYDNFYGENHVANITIAYPISKSDDFIGFYTSGGEHYELDEHVYPDIVNWTNEVNDNSTLLDNPNNYVIRTFSVNIIENSMNVINFKISTNEKEYNRMGMWITYNPGGGALGYSTIFNDSNGKTWYIAEITNGTGNWTVPEGVTSIDVLVVGGGGGAGMGEAQANKNPGAGGAGGLVWIQNITRIGTVSIYPGNNISYLVGNGGIGSTALANRGGIGIDSTFGNLTAKGGGGGGSTLNINGENGGSGGGGARNLNNYGMGGTAIQTMQVGWSGIYGYGNNGSNDIDGGSGGGGGGANSSANGATGGSGIDISSYFGTGYGVNGVFSKGGDGSSNGVAGATNTGNGANANPNNNGGIGANGGSGIILIRWNISEYVTPNPPGNFTATTLSYSSIRLDWVKASDYTYIRYSSISYPTTRNEGLFSVNTTNNYFIQTSLLSNKTYYFSAWSYNSTSKIYSINYSTAYNTTEEAVYSFFDEIPYDGEINVDIFPFLNITVYSASNTSFNLTWYITPNLSSTYEITTLSGLSSGTFSIDLITFNESIYGYYDWEYTWYVTATTYNTEDTFSSDIYLYKTKAFSYEELGVDVYMNLWMIILWLVVWAILLFVNIKGKSTIFGGFAGIWLFLLGLFIIASGIQVETGTVTSVINPGQSVSYIQYTDAILPYSTYSIVWGVFLFLLALYIIFANIRAKASAN
jgi:hypothetical protein